MGTVKPIGISGNLLYSTVMIHVKYANGNEGSGTGFFFNAGASSSDVIPLLITNWHVVENSKSGFIRLHLGNNEGEKFIPSGLNFDARFEEFEKMWIPHPDKNIDLCCLFIAPVFNSMTRDGKHPFFRCLGRDLIPNDVALSELQPLEEIAMLGFPIGLWDQSNNYPLFRRGITAYPPSVDFQGRSEGVIDAACYPGSSGSPILIVNEGSFSTQNGVSIGSRVHLLGVLYGGPQFTTQGELQIAKIPMQSGAWVSTSIPCHLGYYIKSKEIIRMIEEILSSDNKIKIVGASRPTEKPSR